MSGVNPNKNAKPHLEVYRWGCDFEPANASLNKAVAVRRQCVRLARRCDRLVPLVEPLLGSGDERMREGCISSGVETDENDFDGVTDRTNPITV